MAAPVIASNLTNLTNAEAADSASWVEIGGNPSSGQEADIVLQGSASRSKKVSSKEAGMMFDNGSGIDLSADANKHVYIWMNVATVGILDTLANQGIFIRLGTTTANYHDYVVGGSETYGGGWVRFVIDLTKTPTRVGGTGLTTTSVRYFGGGCTTTGSAKSENFIIDRIDYGSDGLQIDEGDATQPCSWQELFDADDLSANKYGIITARAGKFFLRGPVYIGDAASTSSTLWEDLSNADVVFEDVQYYNGTALVSAIDADVLYHVTGQGNATGTTDIDFGQVVGTGDDRRGVSGGSIKTEGPEFTLDFETDIADLDTVNFYGVQVQGANLSRFSSSTKTDVIGCTFQNCFEVQPNDAEFVNCFLVEPNGLGVEMLSTHNIVGLICVSGDNGAEDVARAWQVDESTTPDTYVEMTDECNSAATGDVIPFPATEAVNDYFVVTSQRPFTRIRVDVGTAGVAGVVAWEYWNGSAWAALTGVTDGTTSFTTAGINTVVFTEPTDWGRVSINDDAPQCVIRARITTVYTTNPVLDEVDIEETVEQHVHITATGTYGFDGILFFGHAPDGAPKWHAQNDSGGAVTINALNGSTISDPEVQDIGAATTTVNNTVDLEVTISNENGDLQESVNVRYEQSDGTLIAQGSTNASGVFTFAQNVGDLPFNGAAIVARKLPFEDFELGLNITSAGFDIPITLNADRDVNIPLS